MPPAPANYIAYTAPINPTGAHPRLTIPQIWDGLQRKVRAGQDFIGGAIKDTKVIEEYTEKERGIPVVVRDIVFSGPQGGREGSTEGKKVRETCKMFEPMKVEFWQAPQHEGGLMSLVCNVVSEGAAAHGEQGGHSDLYLTYTFEWMHEGMGPEELEEKKVQEKKMAMGAVESTIKTMRRMVLDGRL